MNLNLKQLEAFVWAVDLGSFSKAATRLNTTQPNISVRINALETALKVQLLERDAGSVRLTAKGKTLLSHARTVLSSVEMLTIASGDESQREGTLRLGVTEMIVHTWLQELLKALNERYPNIQVELTVDLSANLSKELSDRSIDLALQNSPFDRVTSGEMDLGTYPLIRVASPELGLPAAKSSKKKLNGKSLAAHPILTNARDSDLFKALTQHFQSINAHNIKLVPSSNLAACLFMAKNNMGVATLPKAMVSDALKNQEVIEIAYDWTPESLAFKARYDEKKSPQYVVAIATLAQRISNNHKQ